MTDQKKFQFIQLLWLARASLVNLVFFLEEESLGELSSGGYSSSDFFSFYQ